MSAGNHLLGDDPVALAKKRAEAALTAGWEELQTAHEAWWDGFWSKSSVTIPDKKIEQHYNLVQYFGELKADVEVHRNDKITIEEIARKKPDQIVIGAAFYGRAWKGVTPEQNGLYQRNGGSYIGWSAYHQIREKFEEKNGFIRYWDEVAKAPYLFNSTDSIFVSYDDTASVKLKTKYAIDNNLGGIMFWELGNDTKEDNSLLDAIFEAAKE